ncbi:MAG: hypothetical protein J6S78_05765, partial [Lachnospiraceae bacterium]|nr:hypothetical protein [Lachnospiraceae bacterium]
RSRAGFPPDSLNILLFSLSTVSSQPFEIRLLLDTRVDPRYNRFITFPLFRQQTASRKGGNNGRKRFL